VEFGAWDGEYLSNTYNLAKELNFRTILIEGDKKNSNIYQLSFLTQIIFL
jgi:hypothetical protein